MTGNLDNLDSIVDLLKQARTKVLYLEDNSVMDGCFGDLKSLVNKALRSSMALQKKYKTSREGIIGSIEFDDIDEKNILKIIKETGHEKDYLIETIHNMIVDTDGLLNPKGAVLILGDKLHVEMITEF